jgi:chromosome segregation ATPase
MVRVVLTLAMFLLGVASQADPSEPPAVDDDTPQIMAGLAKGESRYAIAEMVWKKRVADVTSDPAKAESEAYQEKLDAAETELAEAQLQLENAQRKDKVAKDTRNEMREAQTEIRKDSKRKVAELKAEKTVLDERNDALLVRVQGLTREQHEMRQTRKEGTLNTELNIRGAVGGMAQAMQRDAQLKDELKEAEDRITGLAEKDAAAKAGVEAAGKIQAALAAAGERFTELGKEKTAKMKALKPPSFGGDSQSGRWYDVQKQGACLDFCRPVEGVWTCTLAGDVEVNSTDYSEVDFPIPCESKGAKSDTDAGRDLIALDKKLDQAMEQVTKLSAMAQATDYHQLQADQVEAAGYVGAAKVQLSLLEHTEENVAQRLAKERAQLEERVSDEDRIAALEQQVKDLEAKKKKKAKQIKALQRAVQLVNNPDASLRQKVDVNHQLQDVGLPYDKLDLED